MIPPGPAPNRFTDLSCSRKRLVAIMRRWQFGRIELLPIAGGHPEFTPRTTIVCTIKLPAEPVAVSMPDDAFLLKRQLIDMFEQFDLFQYAMILRLEFRFGLPFLMELIAPGDATTASIRGARSE